MEDNGTHPARDPVTGRFGKGHPGGPGRPRGVDLRRLAQERSEAEGIDLDSAMWGVLKAMIGQALKGDVQAARLVCDRLSITEAAELHLHHAGSIESVGPTPPATRAELAAYVRQLNQAADDLEEIDRVEQ